MDLGFTGRTVLVTGGSSGVGLAVARMLLAEGANVAACARDGARLRAALGELPRAAGAKVYAHECDVVDEAGSRGFVEASAEEFGGIDGVVNNAGRSLMSPWDRTSDEQWRAELDLKVFSVLNTVRAALPSLRWSSAPAVVNVNAVLARQPEARLAATSAARAALLNLTKTLSDDLAQDGVRVNSVCLGLIETGQWRRRYEESGTELDWASWSAELARDRRIPLGRLGAAEEVAYAIAALLAPRASYITGTDVEVGGGITRQA